MAQPLPASGGRNGALASRTRHSQPVIEAIACDHDLPHDFAGRKVAHEALRAGMAERAGERAADLTREAKRAAISIRNVNAFDLVRPLAGMPVAQAQEPFARAIGRDLLGHDFGTSERELRCQRGTQLFRNARHRSELPGATNVEPVPDLLYAHLALHGRHADACERFAQLRARQAHQRGFCRRQISLERRLFHESRGRGGSRRRGNGRGLQRFGHRLGRSIRWRF